MIDPSRVAVSDTTKSTVKKVVWEKKKTEEDILTRPDPFLSEDEGVRKHGGAFGWRDRLPRQRTWRRFLLSRDASPQGGFGHPCVTLCRGMLFHDSRTGDTNAGVEAVHGRRGVPAHEREGAHVQESAWVVAQASPEHRGEDRHRGLGVGAEHPGRRQPRDWVVARR